MSAIKKKLTLNIEDCKIEPKTYHFSGMFSARFNKTIFCVN